MRILIPIFLLMISACHNSSELGLMDKGDVSGDFEEVMEIPATRQPPQDKESSGSEQITKKVIKTGGIDFQSSNIATDYQKIRALLPKYEAYIENENQTKSSDRIYYTMTIRVPSIVYDTLFSQLSTIGSRLDHRYSNVEDVTERYYDLKTRIRNKKALEERYLDLLKKAPDIKDILEIEKNIALVRTDIERLQGQFNYLSKQVRLSSINLSFYEMLPYVYDSSNRKGFGARIRRALDSGWQGFLSFLVVLTAIWPFLMLVIAGVFIYRKLKQKKNEVD